MLVGYARVSTHEQSLSLQLDALKKADCRKVFDDEISGARIKHPGLKAALEYVREEDTLLVWQLDRLGRAFKDLIEIIGSLEKRGVGFKSFRSPSTPPAVDALYSTSSARWRSSNRT
jgi:DNA invertase Pin-like site-specific DNA recombinase